MHIVDNFERDEALREQAEKTATAIERYRSEKFGVCDEVESLNDLVFYLLGKGKYEENIDAYQDLTVALLRLLLQPKVSEAMGRLFTAEEGSALVQLVHQLYDFFKSLNTEQHRTVFELQYVQYHYAGDNLKRLLTLEKTYQEKLQHYLQEREG